MFFDTMTTSPSSSSSSYNFCGALRYLSTSQEDKSRLEQKWQRVCVWCVSCVRAYVAMHRLCFRRNCRLWALITHVRIRRLCWAPNMIITVAYSESVEESCLHETARQPPMYDSTPSNTCNESDVCATHGLKIEKSYRFNIIWRLLAYHNTWYIYHESTAYSATVGACSRVSVTNH